MRAHYKIFFDWAYPRNPLLCSQSQRVRPQTAIFPWAQICKPVAKPQRFASSYDAQRSSTKRIFGYILFFGMWQFGKGVCKDELLSLFTQYQWLWVFWMLPPGNVRSRSYLAARSLCSLEISGYLIHTEPLHTATRAMTHVTAFQLHFQLHVTCPIHLSACAWQNVEVVESLWHLFDWEQRKFSWEME